MALPPKFIDGNQPERYGIGINLIPGDPQTFQIELQRAADDGGGNPNVGSAVTIATIRALPAATAWIDLLPHDNVRRHYRWRHIGPGYDPGAYTAWAQNPNGVFGAKPVLLDGDAAAGGLISLYPIVRNRPMSDGDFAVSAADSIGRQVIKEGQIEGQGRTLIQALIYEIPNGEFDVWESASQPHAWTVDTGDSSAVAKETSIVFAGDASAKYNFGAGGSAGTFRGLTTNDPTKGAFCIPLHPGTWYQFKFASRCADLTNNPSYRVTLTHDVGGTLISTATFSYRLVNKWQIDLFKFKVPATAEALTKLAIEFTRADTAAKTFYIDGVRYRDVGTQRIIHLTSGTVWTVPSDFNKTNNKIELIGGGANGASGVANTNGGGGGGSAGYRYQDNFDPGVATTVSYVIGGVGADTTWNAGAVVAKGGGAPSGAAGGAAGGAGSGGTGGQSGAAGANGASGTGVQGGGGGGGAGGPGSNGSPGSAGSGAAGGAGGNGGGTGAGLGGASSGGAGNPGGDGTTWVSTDDGLSRGPGGGGGGSLGAAAAGRGGSLGGGAGGGGSSAVAGGAGGAGQQGAIIISYVSVVV